MANKTAINLQKVPVIGIGSMSTANGISTSYSHRLYHTEENIVQIIGAVL